MLQAVVLRDLPYSEPDRIAVMWTRNLEQSLPDGSSYLNFRGWKDQSRQFAPSLREVGRSKGQEVHSRLARRLERP